MLFTRRRNEAVSIGICCDALGIGYVDSTFHPKVIELTYCNIKVTENSYFYHERLENERKWLSKSVKKYKSLLLEVSIEGDPHARSSSAR